jgi:hypothetical protein
LSYDVKTGNWISYHDWHPDLTLSSKNTFLTIKNNGIWTHNKRTDSYCNFYGIDYPFEVEFASLEAAEVSMIRNVFYYMEVYRYAQNGYDRFHVLDFNFDEAVIHNSEQCSGLLRLNLSPKNNAPAIVNYPVINSQNIDILYSKEEQKYRFNQFWDITRDRAEFNTNLQRTIFQTEPNGYIRNLNQLNLDYNKASFERKKFRHHKNLVLLRRRVSGNNNIVLSLAGTHNFNSVR